MPETSLPAPAQADADAPERSGRRRSMARWRHRMRRRWREVRALTAIIFHELIRTNAIDVAAGVAFWLMLSLVPLIMSAVALLAILRMPDFVPQLLGVIAILVPPNALDLVEKLVGTLLTPHGSALSFGIVSYLWSSTSGFVSLIAALNIAYDVKEQRSWLRDRVQAFILTFTSGGLLLISMGAIVAGPHLVHSLDQVFVFPRFVMRLWPILRFATVFVSFVIGLELIYFLGPNMRQRFRSTLPGAVLASIIWFLGSYSLAFYMDHLSNYAKIYGGMGALFGLMFWLYLTSLAILIGAESNAEIAKRRDSIFRRHVQQLHGLRRPGKEKASQSSASGRSAA